MRLALLAAGALLLGGCDWLFPFNPPPPVEPCGPSTCAGCCAVDGACMPGDELAVCGTQGESCKICVDGAQCNSGTCEAPAAQPDTGAPIEDAGPPSCGEGLYLGDLDDVLEIDTTTVGGGNDFTGSCGGELGEDRAFGFRVKQDTHLSIEVIPEDTSLRPLVALRRGCAEEPGCFAATADGAGLLQAGIWVQAGVLWVHVDGVTAGAGPFRLRLRAEATAEACGSALPLSFPPSGLLDISGWVYSRKNDASGSCTGAGISDMVFQLAVPERSDLTLVTEHSGYWGGAYLRSACGGSELACAYEYFNKSSLVYRGLDPGTYHLWLEGTDGFTARAKLKPTAQGEDCTRPLPLTFSGNGMGDVLVNGSFSGAARDEQLGCGGSGRDQVYTFTVTAPSVLFAQTNGSETLALRKGGCGQPTVACVSIGVLEHGVLSPGTYQLIVQTYSSDEGAYQLYAALQPPAAGETCDQPQVVDLSAALDGGTVTLTGDSSAHFEDGVSSCGGAGAPDLVYQLDVPYPVLLSASVWPTFPGSTSYRPVIALREGTCSTGAELACTAATSAGATVSFSGVSVPAGPVYLWVDGVAGTSGDYALNISAQ